MIDKQNEQDFRQIAIDKVGVKGIRYPLTVLDRARTTQSTVAEISMYVGLSHQSRGTHMSRFLEVLNEHGNELHIDSIPQILAKTREVLQSHSAYLEITFPYFLTKTAPVSKQQGLMDYQIAFQASQDNNRTDIEMIVTAWITTLCPCSKAISQSGAHNQRGRVTVHVRTRKDVWFEDIIEIIEQSGSGPLYSLLKRVDEKYVTEYAYNTPVFVEDVVRNCALKLNANPDIIWYKVEAENAESIHNHNAYACITSANRANE